MCSIYLLCHLLVTLRRVSWFTLPINIGGIHPDFHLLLWDEIQPHSIHVLFFLLWSVGSTGIAQYSFHVNHPDSISYLSTEVHGALAVTIILTCLSTLSPPTLTENYTVYIDNKTTVNHINDIIQNDALPHPMTPAYDTFDQIKRLMKMSITGQWEWVKAHQTDSQEPKAWLNNDVDVL